MRQAAPPSPNSDALALASGAIFARRTTMTCAPGRAPATHAYAALAFHVDGGARLEQRGAWRLEPGDAVLIPAGEPHRMLEASRLDFWGLGFCTPCFAGPGSAALLEPFERVRDGASAVVRIPTERHAFLEQLFAELAATPTSAATATVQRSLLTLILHEVSRAADHAAAPTQRETPPLGRPSVVTESLRFIERRCLGPLTLDEVASAVGRTPSYVTTALKRATGKSAVEWMIAGRMAEARRRLLQTDERVDDIAARVGYADATHFIRLFRRTHGATPASFRRAAQANLSEADP